MLNRIEFRKAREFGEIINDTFTFIKQNFKPLLKVFIYLCGFFIVAGMIAAIAQQLGIVKSIRNPGGLAAFSRANIFSIRYLFVLIFALANYTATIVAVLSYIALYIKNDNTPPTVEEVWAYFKYYFFRVLGGNLFVSFFFGICFVACIIPGIYVFPAMSLFFPIMILENASIGYSFSRGFKLVKDFWWPTAGAIFIVWIITYATTSMASLPALLLTMFGVFGAGSAGLSDAIVIVTTIIQYLCQVFMIIPVIGITLCYFNLLERQENAGLLDRIDKLGENKEANFDSSEQY